MTIERPAVSIIGGGLAGSEAAWQLARRGFSVALYEMRPVRSTPAHKTDRLAELVCSNSLKSDEPGTAPFLLKEELRRAGSLLLEVAAACRVPGGTALTVDRVQFAERVTEKLSTHPRIRLFREEVTRLPEQGVVLIATGPLTSDALSEELRRLTGRDHLYFYDAISPIVDAETIDYRVVFRAARYGKGGDDYLNCPLTEEQYHRFYEALIAAATVDLHDFDRACYFEGCLPIEEMARRGRLTLAYGPMKPVGLVDPRTGRRPFAVVQLRQESLLADSYNLVGFQTQLKWGEQKRVFRLIPGLERAEFIRYGMVHRNTYINSPVCLLPTLQLRADPRLFVAGQLTGVEGYVECIATGLVAGILIADFLGHRRLVPPPWTTACGSLLRYITESDARHFQPGNIAFALLPPVDPQISRGCSKIVRRQLQIERALGDFEQWIKDHEPPDRAGDAVTDKATAESASLDLPTRDAGDCGSAGEASATDTWLPMRRLIAVGAAWLLFSLSSRAEASCPIAPPESFDAPARVSLRCPVVPLSSGRRLAASRHSRSALPSPEQRGDSPQAIVLRSDLVLVTTTVIGPGGEFVKDLTRDDFEIFEDDVPQTILLFAGESSIPLRLVVVFDTSLSVKSRFEFEKQALRRFFSSVVRRGDQAALVSVSTDVTVEHGLTSNVDMLVTMVERLRSEGATALYDALVTAAGLLRDVPGRRAILILSDGRDTLSRTTLAQALRGIQDVGAVIYAINTATADASANLRELIGERALEILARETGGEVYSPHRLDELDPILARLTEQLRHQYVLGFSSSNEARDGSFRRLSVRVKRDGMIARARSGYYAPTR
jgi:methylenetetrahydrofolate--tRNA-(uracil-5-)-methyltransferase